LALCVVLSYFLGEGRGFVSGTSIFAMIFLVQVSWPIRKEIWFWVVTAVFAAVHGWAVFHLDWSWVEEGRNLRLLGFFWMVEVGVMAGIVYTAYRLKYGAPSKTMEASLDDLPRYGDRDIGP